MVPAEILVVLHQRHSTPGRVGELLERRGYHLDRRCPCIGDPLPECIDDYAGAVVFGGPQSANDDHEPGIRAELDWLEHTALPSARPLLGICLGAQQIARVLGARVGAHPHGLVEIGYHAVQPTAGAASFLERPTMFYQWHSETFEIPSDAVHLAENERFPGQAFCYREHAYAIEFHPEMTIDMIDRWCTSDSGSRKLGLDGATSHAEQRSGYARFAEESDRWLESFLDTLLGIHADRAVPATPAGGHAPT